MIFFILAVYTTINSSFGITIHSELVYEELSDRILDAYVCFCIRKMMIGRENKTFTEYIKLVKSNENADKIRPRVNFILGRHVENYMRLHDKTSEHSIESYETYIFKDEYFDNNANKLYIVAIKEWTELYFFQYTCIFHYIAIAKIPRKQKIHFLRTFYAIEKVRMLKDYELTFNGKFDTDGCNTFAKVISDANKNHLDPINICFYLDLTDITFDLVSQLDSLINEWCGGLIGIKCAKNFAQLVKEAKGKVISDFVAKQASIICKMANLRRGIRIIFDTQSIYIFRAEYVLLFLQHHRPDDLRRIFEIVYESIKKFSTEVQQSFVDHCTNYANRLQTDENFCILRSTYLHVISDTILSF